MTRETVHRWLGLFAVTVAAAATWMVVLPQIETVDHVRSRIEFLESEGVDPSALYYTDLEAMSRLEASVTSSRRRAPRAFWVPTRSLDRAERTPDR